MCGDAARSPTGERLLSAKNLEPGCVFSHIKQSGQNKANHFYWSSSGPFHTHCVNSIASSEYQVKRLLWSFQPYLDDAVHGEMEQRLSLGTLGLHKDS